MGTVMPPIPWRSGRHGIRAVCVALTGLALAGCTGTDHAKGPIHSTTATSTPRATTTPDKATGRAEHIEGESVTEAPKLPSGEPLVRVASAKGNRQMELGKIAAEPLSVLVNCQGKGTLTVKVRPMNLTFPLTCVAEEVSSTYNELRLATPRNGATVEVTAPSTVRWSLTVGH
ncbi:hypothetical protein [Streptomyces sp. NPDC003697]